MSEDGSQRYSNVRVHELPGSVSAAGVRHGVVNLLCQFMPPEFAVAITGHSLKSMISLYEYLTRQRIMNIPGMTALAGFPAFPWGQIGKSPQPASLEALKGTEGVTDDTTTR